MLGEVFHGLGAALQNAPTPKVFCGCCCCFLCSPPHIIALVDCDLLSPIPVKVLTVRRKDPRYASDAAVLKKKKTKKIKN